QRPTSRHVTGRGSFVPAPVFFRRPFEPLERGPAFCFVQGNHSLKLSDETTLEVLKSLREADDVVLQALGYPKTLLLEDQGGYRDRHGVSVHGNCPFYDISTYQARISEALVAGMGTLSRYRASRRGGSGERA